MAKPTSLGLMLVCTFRSPTGVRTSACSAPFSPFRSLTLQPNKTSAKVRDAASATLLKRETLSIRLSCLCIGASCGHGEWGGSGGLLDAFSAGRDIGNGYRQMAANWNLAKQRLHRA